jgi:cell division protein ZipA
MSPLQVAILVLAIAVVIALFAMSRSERNERPARAPQAPSPPGPGAGEVAERPFDEFGVGQPRSRGGGRIEPSALPMRPQPTMTIPPPAAPPPSAAGYSSTATTRELPQQRVIAFYIAEREGTHIFGPAIHKALQDQGLRYGAHQIYHRAAPDGRELFSVASLLKPGTLNPEAAAGFSTPGLSVFMVLPGPARPVACFLDMLETSQRLASALHAELYDDQRQPLSRERTLALRTEVEDWARRAGA